MGNADGWSTTTASAQEGRIMNKKPLKVLSRGEAQLSITDAHVRVFSIKWVTLRLDHQNSCKEPVSNFMLC